MRIIGGIFKGVKIFEAFDKNTRPLKDLVKESILNILEHSKDLKISLKEIKNLLQLMKYQFYVKVDRQHLFQLKMVQNI